MLADIWEYTTERAKIRVALAVTIGIIIMLYCGAAESWRCLRSLLPPGQISYPDATAAAGLAGYGHVRVSGVHPRPDRAAIIVRGKGNDVLGAYVPIEPGAPAAVQGGSTVLAWLPGADGGDPRLTELSTSSDLVGFVDTTFDFHADPARQNLIRGLSGGRTESCWVVEVRTPSWLKAIGRGGGAIAIRAGLVLYLMKKPLNP